MKTNMLIVGKVTVLAPAYGTMQRPRSLPLCSKRIETLANADPDIGDHKLSARGTRRRSIGTILPNGC
jgi:hypothetical protein